MVVVELSCVWEAESDENFTTEEDKWAMKAKAAGWKWRSTVEKRRAAKRFKYSEELMNALPREWPPQLVTLEIGSRGLVAPETKQDMHNIFRFLGHTKDAKSQTEKCIAEARRRAMLGSYLVWCFRGRDDWDFQETIGSWRGQAEVYNIAAADRIRQKEEQEERTREVIWTDWSNQEPEESPDK